MTAFLFTLKTTFMPIKINGNNCWTLEQMLQEIEKFPLR